MDWFSTLTLALGSAWTSGINLYATVSVLGLLQKFSAIKLPGGLDVLDNWWIIGIAGGLYLVEFVADKVPYVDSVWDVDSYIYPRSGGRGGGVCGDESDGLSRQPLSQLCSAADSRFLRTAQKPRFGPRQIFRPNLFPTGFYQSSKTSSLLPERFSPSSRRF